MPRNKTRLSIPARPSIPRLPCGVVLAALLAACGGDAEREGAFDRGGDGDALATLPPEAGGLDLLDRSAQAGRYQRFLQAVVDSGLEQDLRDRALTIFMPTDTAFDKLPDVQRDWLLAPANRDKLVELLRHHMVDGTYTATDLGGRSIQLQSLAGRPLRVDFTGAAPAVSLAAVVQPDVRASNGVVHGIDAVLVPF